MATDNTAYFRKVITMGLVVMAFFIFSCERKLVLKEPPPKEIIVEKPVIEKPVAEEPLEEKPVVDHFAVAEESWRQKDYDNALAAYDRYLSEFPS
jgi:hypothetical protein